MRESDNQDKIVIRIWKEAVRELSERDRAENWVHGIPHIIRVWNNLQFFLEKCSLENNMVRNLKIAVIVHDVGRGLPGDHAENSAKIFDRIKIEGLEEDEAENIMFAVRNHNKKLKINIAKSDKEVLLGLLILFDHMDALGKIGFYRTIQWSKDTGRNLDLLSGIDSKELEEFIKEDYLSSEIEKLNLKEESILAHEIYNYIVTEKMIKPIFHFLSIEFLQEIEYRRKELLGEIFGMIELMKK